MSSHNSLETFIKSNQFANMLPRLYGKNYNKEFQIKRFVELVAMHQRLFVISDTTNTGIFSTAGRSELAGNHTDHNLGQVIAATIDLDTIAAVTPINSPNVTLVSEGFPPVSVSLIDLEPQADEQGTTDALVRGIAAGFVKRGLLIGGFVANTSTRVLKGSGLSSSAAIEILVATIFNSLYNEESLDPIEMAIIGKFAENNYFGKPSGLMDQIACGHGGITGIDFAHPEQPQITSITCDFNQLGYDLVVVDTGGSHADLTPDYAAIPAEMNSVAEYFNEEVLRKVSLTKFLETLPDLRKQINNDRALLRAYHYLSENERVEKMLKALQEKAIDEYLALVRESGNSSFRFLQNLYSPSNFKEQGLSLAIALTEQFLQGQGACRVHGGGFAGTIQVYVPVANTAAYIKFIEGIWGPSTATILAIRSAPTMRLDKFIE